MYRPVVIGKCGWVAWCGCSEWYISLANWILAVCTVAELAACGTDIGQMLFKLSIDNSLRESPTKLSVLHIFMMYKVQTVNQIQGGYDGWCPIYCSQ